MSYCRELRDAIAARMEAKDGIRSCNVGFKNKSYTSHYLKRGKFQGTRTSEGEVC